MGRKLNILLGRNLKTSKLKTTLNLAISRLFLLKNQRRVRHAIARSDVVQLLHLNHHEHALLRIEQVIKDQNMLDVYDMIHGYCHILIQHEKERPDELEEATSNLLYAAPRCGEFPELQEIRAILTTRFGKEFAYGAIELRNDSRVSQKMVEKLSSKQSNLHSRMKMLIEIATENGILLELDEPSLNIQKEKLEVEEALSLSESMKGRKNCKDAAQAAVELYPLESFDSDSDSDSDSYDYEISEGHKRNAYNFSSYKQFPFRHQANVNAENHFSVKG